MHFAAGRLRVDQELACDAAVIDRYPFSRRAYAGAMLKTLLADGALPVGCHWRSIHPLKERLEMLKESAPGRIRREFGRVFVAIASLAVGYVAWASDPVADPAPLAQPPVAPTEEDRGSIDMRANRVNMTDNGGGVFEGDVVVTFRRMRITADLARVSAQTPLTRSAEWIFEGNVIATSDGREWFRGEVLKLKFSSGHMNIESFVGADRR
jgi:BlaR1 peptidase M56